MTDRDKEPRCMNDADQVNNLFPSFYTICLIVLRDGMKEKKRTPSFVKGIVNSVLGLILDLNKSIGCEIYSLFSVIVC